MGIFQRTAQNRPGTGHGHAHGHGHDRACSDRKLCASPRVVPVLLRTAEDGLQDEKFDEREESAADAGKSAGWDGMYLAGHWKALAAGSGQRPVRATRASRHVPSRPGHWPRRFRNRLQRFLQTAFARKAYSNTRCAGLLKLHILQPGEIDRSCRKHVPDGK